MDKGLQQAVVELSNAFEIQTFQLSAIKKLVANSISHNTEFSVAEEAKSVLIEFDDIHNVDIYIFSDNTLHLIESTPSKAQKKIDLGESITGIVAQTKEQLFVDNSNAKTLPNQTSDDASSTPFICTPIMYENDLIGILNTFSDSFDEHKEPYLRFLPIFCGVLAALLKNSKSAGSMKHDIYRQQNELEAALDKATKESDAKTSFLLGMSHDLRSPLNSILGFSQLLEIDECMSEGALKYVDQISAAGKHLLALINQILDLAGIDAGHTGVSQKSTDCYSVVSSCIDLLDGQVSGNGNTLINKIKPEKLPLINVDKVRMKQVLINLLSNAIKYNKPNGSITLTSLVSDTHVTLSVIDQGYGIPPEKIDDVFEPFKRLGMEASNIEGTGLGLALSKNLVALMGGDIGVESTPNIGCRFWFSVPIFKA